MKKIIGSMFVIVLLIVVVFLEAMYVVPNSSFSFFLRGSILVGGFINILIWTCLSILYIRDYRAEKKRLAENLHRYRWCCCPCPYCRARRLEAEDDEEWKKMSLREKNRMVKLFLRLAVENWVCIFINKLYAGLEKVRSVFLRRRRRAAEKKWRLLADSIVTFQQKVEMCRQASAFLPRDMEPTRRVRCLVQKPDMTRVRAQYLLEHKEEFIKTLRSMVLV